MNRTKRLKGACMECGSPIEFSAEMIGAMTQCPRCRKQTELRLASPSEEPAVPRKVVIWTVVTIAILILGAIVLVVALKHFEKLAARQKNRTMPAPAARTTNSTAPGKR